MVSRILVRSIRFRVLSVLFVTGAIGIIGSFLVANRVEQASDFKTLANTSRALSRSLSELAAGGEPRSVFVAVAHSSPGYYLLVYRNGKVVFSSSLNVPTSVGRIKIVRELDNISVTVVSPLPNSTTLSAELTAVSAIVILGVLLGAVWVTRIISEGIGTSVEKASKVAEAIQSGDLTARLDVALPPEFERLVGALDNMARRLEQSDFEQRRFLSDLAHEIATPINSVTGLAIAITDHTIETETDKHEVAELIQSETKRIHNLLDDLRALDTLELTQTATVTNFDSLDVCQAAYKRFLPTTKSNGVTLRFKSDLSPLSQDRRLLEMVLDNFLTNAIRYVNPGDSIYINGQSVGNSEFLFSVKDTGIGIETKHMDRIFDRLYRVNEARDRVSGGSGLGLSIARRAALSIGGHINVQSEYGSGSTFSLTIPLVLVKERSLSNGVSVLPETDSITSSQQ